MPKKLLGVLLTVVLLLALPLTVGAAPLSAVPYTTYDYNLYDESVVAPVGYVPAERITSDSWGLEVPMSSPSDIFYDNKESVYVLDSGNSRILVLDTDLKLKQVIDDLKEENGEPASFTSAEGFTVGNDGRMYIADTANERVLVYNADHSLAYILTRPETARLEEDLLFDVSKVSVDNRNNLYVIAKSGNMGAFVFDGEGKYQRLFGGNTVVQTAEVIMKYLLRPFLTQQQLEAMASSVPITISNFDVNDEGFMYTATVITGKTTVPEGVIRKLNYLGKNILDNEMVLGDREWGRNLDKNALTTFTDLDIDDDGFMNLLDQGRGKVFQYAESGELIAVFGSYGDQFGQFGNNPPALETLGKSVCVLDKEKLCIIRFEPTAYAERYRDALLKLEKNDFDGSLEVWQELLRENSNNVNAYYGMGSVYDMQSDYKEAMKYFKIAGDRFSYSEAFQEQRNVAIKAAFIPAVAVIVVLLVAWALFKKFRKAKVKVASASAYSKLESKYTFPLYTLFHPMDGFSQLKPRKIASWRVSAVLTVALFFVFTMNYFLTGYIFNMNRLVDYSLAVMVVKTIGLVVLFVIANWAVCTLFNGNGNLREIASVTSYSLVPLEVAMVVNVVLSNFLAMSEGAIMNIILIVAIAWSVLLLLCGLYCIHEYNMTQTVISVIASVLGMAVIAFLLIMFFSLLQQTGSFIYSIILELIQR